MDNYTVLYKLKNGLNVIEWDELGRKIRALKSENAILSTTYVDEKKYDNHFLYQRLFDFPLTLKKDIKNTLLLGAGCFTYPKYYISKYQDKYMDAVEIDQEIIDVSYDYFFLNDLYNNFDKSKERLSIFNEDAYDFICQCQKKYDYIIVDIFVDHEPLEKFLNEDFIQKIVHHLSEDGIFSTNYIVNQTKEDKFHNYLKVLKNNFKYVHLLSVDYMKDLKSKNVFILCSNVDYQFDVTNY